MSLGPGIWATAAGVCDVRDWQWWWSGFRLVGLQITGVLTGKSFALSLNELASQGPEAHGCEHIRIKGMAKSQATR